MILSDKTLLNRIEKEKIVTPFIKHKSRRKVGSTVPAISFGLSECGVDVRAADTFYIARMSANPLHRVIQTLSYFYPFLGRLLPKNDLTVMDPKDQDLGRDFIKHTGDVAIIPPWGFALFESVERIRMPLDLVATVIGKSTYARVALNWQFTPLEPGWGLNLEGDVGAVITMEATNPLSVPAKIYTGEGVAQILFWQIDQAVKRGYGNGVYQGQTGATTARVG